LKEPVRNTKHPYLLGAVIALLVGGYVSLIANDHLTDKEYENLEYDITQYLAIDEVESRYEEVGQIVPKIEGARTLETDADGNLYVGGENAIVIYNAGGKETSRIEIEGRPTCLEFTPDGRLLVGLEDKVIVLGADYAQKATWGNFSERSYITAMAAGEDEVYLADYAGRCVLRVDYDGKVLNRIGEADEKRDIPGLEVPSPHFDLAFDQDGQLWVVNPGKLGLERYRENGDIVTSWYRASITELDSFSGCCNPTQIAFNSKGRLITCEKGPVRVKVFEVTSGSFEELVVGSSAFHVPQSIGDMVVDAQDRILVLDPKKNAVRIFEQTRTTLASTDSIN